MMPAMQLVWRCLAAMRWLVVTNLAWIDRYIDLLFLTLIVVLCISKIVTN